MFSIPRSSSMEYFPPPSYNEVVRTHANDIALHQIPFSIPNIRVTFMDFLPVCIRDNDIFSNTRYEPFSKLIDKANNWLSEHNNFAVINCETVCAAKDPEKSYIDSKLTSLTPAILEESEFSINMIKFLRLYLRSKTETDPSEANQIGYYNIVPNLNDSENENSIQKHGPIESTIRKFNNFILQNSINGKIINLETVGYSKKHFPENPEESRYHENTFDNSENSIILRIFYMKGSPTYEQIGTIEFLPNHNNYGRNSPVAVYDSTGELIERAQRWLEQHNTARVLNLQTTNIDFKKAMKKETLRSIEDLRSKYCLEKTLSSLRLYYIIGESPLSFSTIGGISARTFTPALLVQKTCRMHEFETLDKLFEREIIPYLNYNSNARIINAETVPYFISNSSELSVYSKKRRPEIILTCIRIYFDTPVSEPPPGFIHKSEPPIFEQEGCCNVL
ncbi:DgyrCDS9048 [Dimorphilus gyrociliatus]|uniref:DgyrCDS9048 n=1 Tax=Dimorphilus gyrociliatus TaxID=2664684 RepID=A0A7I8VVX6_9ANNE|nr:DgyrCDS9048 [Dimorphilus gyrociliatus]